MARSGFLVFTFVLGALLGAPAHEITALSVVADLKDSGAYRLELGVDVKLVRDEALAGETTAPDVDTPMTAREIEEVEAQVEEYLSSSLRFFFDEAQVTPPFRIEEADDSAEEAGAVEEENGKEPRTRYAAIAEGDIPGEAKEFLLEVTPEARAPVVLVIFRNGKPTRHSQVLYSGEFSRPVDLASLHGGEGARTEPETEAGATAPLIGAAGEPSPAWGGARKYLVLGFFIIAALGIYWTVERFFFSR